MDFKTISFGSPQYQQSLALRQLVLRTPLGLILSEIDLRNEDQQLHFGIFDQAVLAACVVIKPTNSGAIAKLRQMAVASGFQGKNIGKILLKSVEQALKEHSFSTIELSARTTAIGFYQKFGYQIKGQQYIEQSISHIKMTKVC